MIVGGLLVVAVGVIHLRLWSMGYRKFPVIGPMFLLQGISGILLGAAVVRFRSFGTALTGALYMLAGIYPRWLWPTSTRYFGTANYFRYGNSARKFTTIDGYVHERLVIFMSRKHGRSGRNWVRHYHLACLKHLGVHRLSGTVRYGTAHASR